MAELLEMDVEALNTWLTHAKAYEEARANAIQRQSSA
jgi:hypothetical protein